MLERDRRIPQFTETFRRPSRQQWSAVQYTAALLLVLECLSKQRAVMNLNEEQVMALIARTVAATIQ